MINLIGKKVIGFDGYGKREGKVIGEENPKYGFDSWVIKWKDGSKDTHSKHTLKHESEHVGIGVCWIEDEEKKGNKAKVIIPIYFTNDTGIIQ